MTPLAEEIDKDAKPFGRYELAKLKIIVQLNAPKMEKKRKNIIENMQKELGELEEKEKPLYIIQGKGEDLRSKKEK